MSVDYIKRLCNVLLKYYFECICLRIVRHSGKLPPVSRNINRKSNEVLCPIIRLQLITYLLGVGKDISSTEVNGIASHTDNVFLVDSYSGVQELTDEIAAKICGISMYQFVIYFEIRIHT